MTGSTRMLVRRMLPTGGLTLELVASHLAVHPRTLQRQLAAEGRTFAEVVQRATSVIPGQPNLVKKVVFPLDILPATLVEATSWSV